MGTNSNHTPGPWRYISRNLDDKAPWCSRIPFAIERALGTAVAPVADIVANPLVEVCDQPHAEANARLIAAAPDLLAALEALRSHVSFDARTDSQTKLDAMRAADEAIAKAEGR